MIEFGGTFYYIDLNALDKALAPIGIKPNDVVKTNEKKIIKDGENNIISIEEYESSSLRGKEIDAAKFEVVRTMIEVILDYEDESDSSLGAERALDKTPLSYKLAFNTLYNYGILKEKE
jgi:hypothetical protein